MNKNFIFCMLAFSLLSTFSLAQSYVPEYKDMRMKVKNATPIHAYSFNLSQVQLLESTFKKAMRAEEAYLLELEPDRLLAGFRINAGLKEKAKIYGGWESDGLAGHTLGHYLSAISMQYASTKNPAFLKKINYVVDELIACQIARKTGYIGAIPKEDHIWSEVAKGNIKSGGFDLNGGWSPWYTVHKVMAGLADAYLYADNQKALDACLKMANWTDDLLAKLNDEQLQKMLFCEYGGMAETIVNLYALTANEKYLKLSYKFYDKRILDPLAEGKDILPGKHSNTQIPKVIASARRYELNGDKKDLAIADFFWKIVVNNHSYVTGGNSNYEYLGEPNKLNDKLTENTTETCNTYNMLKLTRHLFALQPKANLFDYYEKALYNHILASQNHETGMTCYFVPLRMGGKKEYSDKFNTFTCCVGSGMENHVKYNESIYFRGNDGSLFVNLFIPSVLNWKEKGLKLTQNSTFPNTAQTTLTLALNKPTKFAIRLRSPKWATDPAVVINGKKQQINIDENGYFVIDRIWKTKDKITYTLPQHLYTETMPDNVNRRAVFYGPVLLAGALGEKEPDPLKGVPVFVSANNDPKNWIKAVNKSTLTFATHNIAKPTDVALIPFYETKNQYYSVYWDVFTPETWVKQQKIYEDERLAQIALENKTTDLLRLGEMQPERDHNLSGEKLTMGEEHGKKWRTAEDGGYMQFTLKTDPTSENTLIATYWGMDNRGRTFDILINDQKLITVDINKFQQSKFYDISYKLPLDLTKGKDKVTIKFLPKAKNNAGPIYGIRMIKE